MRNIKLGKVPLKSRVLHVDVPMNCDKNLSFCHIETTNKTQKRHHGQSDQLKRLLTYLLCLEKRNCYNAVFL